MKLLCFLVPYSSCLLPSPLLRVRVPLLPSSFSFYLHFLKGLFIFGALALSGLPSASALAFFSLHEFLYSWRIFSGIRDFLLGFSRHLSALVSLSPGDSHVPFLLFSSRLLILPFVSFSTFSGVLMHSPDSMRLCTSSSFGFFSSVFTGNSSSVVYFSYYVSCALYLWPLDIYSTFPISVPLLILLIVCGFGLLPPPLQLLYFSLASYRSC